VHGIPDISPGDDLAALLVAGCAESGIRLQRWDVVVVTQKVVSKAEGALVDLAAIEPSSRARELAAIVGYDPRVVEVVMRESIEVLRAEPGVLLCVTRHGHVTANAGVDHSNVGGVELVSVLPDDPDASAGHLRSELLPLVDGGPLAVIVCDSFGRPFRVGTVNVAVGVAGMPAISDYQGARDTYDQPLQTTVLASADEVAAAADLVMGKVERVPVAVLRGLRWEGEETGVAPLLRPKSKDIFRRTG